MVLFGGGCAWFYAGGVHGFIWGACMVLFGGGMHGFSSFFGYNEIRSMSGRYASYWNAFLLLIYIAGDGHRYGLGLRDLYYTEIGSRDLSPSLCNVNIM